MKYLGTRWRACALLAASLVPLAAQAQWNVSTDFNTVTNAGTWTYGWRSFGSLLSTSLNLYTNTVSFNGWDLSWTSNNNVPIVSKNVTNTTQGVTTVPAVAPGQVDFHPGPGGEYSVVRFTAPSTSIFNIASSFSGLDCCTTNTDVHVLLNGVQLYGSFVIGLGDVDSYNSTLGLAAGDVLDFVVGANGSYFDDTTGLDIQIDEAVTTPEPSALVLLGSGLFGLGTIGRRRRRAY